MNLNIDLAQLDAQFEELIGIGDSPHDNGDGSTAVKAETVKEEVKSEATPTKRRRTGRLSRGGSSQSLSHGVADVEVGDDPDGSEAAAAVAGDSAQDGGEDKICIGCSRIHGVSPCLLNPGETVQWSLKDGRGCWCKDCHSVWRIVFKKRGFLNDLED